MAELVQPVPDLGYLSLPSTVQIVDVANAAELQQCSKLLSVCSVIGTCQEMNNLGHWFLIDSPSF